jgi:hypothetical protein
MSSRNSWRIAAVFSLLSLTPAVAQETPRVEIFGGYSVLGLPRQPRLQLGSATLQGWKASFKWNVTPRAGLLADFSGHSGNPAPMTGGREIPRRRQHAYLFGLETRIWKASRIGVNGRALLGAAGSGVAAAAPGAPPAASAVFAAAFGASLDYRLTEHCSLRLAEPEAYIARMTSSATNQWQQIGFRFSSGFVFTPGKAAAAVSAGAGFTFGVIGGAALTGAFGHESGGFILLPGGGLEPVRTRSYSTLKDYVIGAAVESGPLWRRLSVEFDALYRPMNLTMAGVRADGSLHSVSPATVVTWEFPVLAKWRFGAGAAGPFLQAGPSFRASGNLNGASPSPYGLTAGIGFQTRA